jgi:epoxyqueuosine reductase QueG
MENTVENAIENTIAGIINDAVEASNKSDRLTKYRAPVIGFASTEDPLFDSLNAIIGYPVLHPKNILPGAKTVIAFFVPFDTRVIKFARHREHHTNREWSLAYYELNFLLEDTIARIVTEMTRLGVGAAREPVTENYDPVTLTTNWPHKSAGYIAGLGTFGINRVIITPLGCSGRIASVVIDEEITPTRRPKGENCLYKSSGLCGACVKRCPSRSLRFNSFSRFTCNLHTDMRTDPSYLDRGCCRCNTAYCASFEKPLPNHHVWIGRQAPE